MKPIFFPSHYKKAILDNKKNMTLRVKSEIGKYKKGQTYRAKSYAGTDWKVDIKVLDVIKTSLSKLSDFGIPKSSIDLIRKKEKLKNNSPVELIKFKVVK